MSRNNPFSVTSTDTCAVSSPCFLPVPVFFYPNYLMFLLHNVLGSLQVLPKVGNTPSETILGVIVALGAMGGGGGALKHKERR